MISKCFFIAFAFIITWACLIETTLGAAGWCYQCDGTNAACLINIDAVALSTHRVPCNGQCYISVKDNVMYRGCSWEHGFMARQSTYTPIFDQGAMWIFCDTSLCNANANI